MFRTTRYFDKNDGKHNLYGELEYVEDWEQDAGEEDSGQQQASENTPDKEDRH